MTMKVRPLRALLLVSASTASGYWLANEGLGQAADPATLESLITAGVLIGGAAAASAVAATTGVALVQSLLGWRPRAAGALPRPLRRFLLGATAVALVAGAALPANADEAYPGWAPAVGSPSPGPTLEVPSPAPSPSPMVTQVSDETTSPDEPLELHAESAASPLPRAAGEGSGVASADASSAEHVVVRGDSLWRIAAAQLGPGASDAEIARAWPAIYQANRAVIGENPSLIVPGQHLTIPQELAS